VRSITHGAGCKKINGGEENPPSVGFASARGNFEIASMEKLCGHIRKLFDKINKTDKVDNYGKFRLGESGDFSYVLKRTA
jgi:hypothetical protein